MFYQLLDSLPVFADNRYRREEEHMAKKRAAGEGSIRQLPSGNWQALLSLEGRRISKTFHTQREAKEWTRKISGQIIDGGLTYSSTRITVREYMADWLGSIKGRLRPKTHEQYIYINTKYITPELGKILLKDLRPDQIQRFCDAISDGKKTSRTANLAHAVLRAALNRAVELGLVLRNPASIVHPPKYSHEEMKVLTDSQVSAFQVAARGDRLEALYKIAVNTGARESEILGLKWSDVDWAGKCIKISKQVQRRKAKEGQESYYFGPLKTDKSHRTVPLGDDTLALLRQHYDAQLLERRVAGGKWADNDLVFPSLVGTPIEASNLRKYFRRILERAGLPRIRFHDLRHTAATIMLVNKISPLVVSRRLGHANSAITQDIYGHDDPEAQREAANLMDRLVTPVKLQEEKKS
jgi:integrase